MSSDETNRLNELVRTFARREAEIVLRNAENVFTGEMASRLMDTVTEMASKVGAMDTKLGVVGFQVDNLEHTLLGNARPGKCKEHSDAITALRDFMNGLKAQFRLVTVVSGTAIGLSGLVLTAGIFFYGIIHRSSQDMQTFHASVQADQQRSAVKQKGMQDSLDAAAQGEDAAKVQRDEIQKFQKDGPTVIIREFIREKPKHIN